MSEIFADTFYFLALLSPSAKTSQRARSITAKQGSSRGRKTFQDCNTGNATWPDRAGDPRARGLCHGESQAAVRATPTRWLDNDVNIPA